MSRQLKRALLVAGLAIPFAELGHLLAYGVRVPSTGSHFYFPTLLQVAGGGLGAGLLTSLAVLALARLLTGTVRRRRPWSFPLLFAGLLAAQMAVFLVQESLESGSLPQVATVTAGLLGQQPVALVAAIVLRWLSARLAPAARALASMEPDQGSVRGALKPQSRLLPGYQPSLAAARIRARGQRAPPI
jgi:hypothetical protein